jgi:hypothetical protein
MGTAIVMSMLLGGVVAIVLQNQLRPVQQIFQVDQFWSSWTVYFSEECSMLLFLTILANLVRQQVIIMLSVVFSFGVGLLIALAVLTSMSWIAVALVTPLAIIEVARIFMPITTALMVLQFPDEFYFYMNSAFSYAVLLSLLASLLEILFLILVL